MQPATTLTAQTEISKTMQPQNMVSPMQCSMYQEQYLHFTIADFLLNLFNIYKTI